MASIYSTQLANRSGAGSFSGAVATVPANHIVVVTDVETFTNDSAAGFISFVSLGAAIICFTDTVAAGFTQRQWSGKQVLTAGQTVSWQSGSTAWNLAVTGYLLQVL
jgi:hypothetical protein